MLLYLGLALIGISCGATSDYGMSCVQVLGDFSWRSHPGLCSCVALPSCLLDRGLLPYETDRMPYFDQFPVILVSAASVFQWGRYVYRSDFARYGDQWDRKTWWIHRRIQTALAKGELIARAIDGKAHPERLAAGERSAALPAIIVNPFAINAAHEELPSSCTPDEPPKGQTEGTVSSLSTGPRPVRIANPYAVRPQ